MRPFKIEKNIPVPDRKRGNRQSSYPFLTLKVGDSFLMPLADEGRVRAAVSYQHETRKARYTTRRMQNGIRVWRVK